MSLKEQTDETFNLEPAHSQLLELLLTGCQQSIHCIERLRQCGVRDNFDVMAPERLAMYRRQGPSLWGRALIAGPVRVRRRHLQRFRNRIWIFVRMPDAQGDFDATSIAISSGACLICPSH
jgi:hypothetical protein